MKILMVNKFLYPNGGSETYMLNLGNHLTGLGHEVQYFGMQDDRNVAFNQANAYVPNVDFHAEQISTKDKLRLGLETVYSVTARTELKKVLEDFQPDVVHMNNINFQLTPSIIYEIKKHHIPVVQTVHDVQIACPCHRFYIEQNEQICEQCLDHHYYHCLQNKCLQGSLAKSGLATVESYLYHTLNTYNQVDCYICPSRFISEKLEAAGVQADRLKVLYNFYNPVTLPDTAAAEEKYVLYFGRLSQEKGIRTLLNVAKELPEVNFVIAGSGPLESLVEETAKTLPNLSFKGFCTGAPLHQLIQGAAFSVYPSEWYENCPLSVIESQALGTPVVGSDLGGTKELIQDGVTGLVFPGCHQAALRDSIQKLWNDDNLINNMSAQCKNITVPDIQNYTMQLLDLYQRYQ